MTTEIPDPCPTTILKSIGKYILYQPMHSLEIYYFILNTENVAHIEYDYPLLQTVMGNML